MAAMDSQITKYHPPRQTHRGVAQNVQALGSSRDPKVEDWNGLRDECQCNSTFGCGNIFGIHDSNTAEHPTALYSIAFSSQVWSQNCCQASARDTLTSNHHKSSPAAKSTLETYRNLEFLWGSTLSTFSWRPHAFAKVF